jgi:hypothetical protein
MCRSETLSVRELRVTIWNLDARLGFAEALSLLRTDSAFRVFLNASLGDAPLDAFRWETPPVSSATMDQPFEFVLIDSPGLAKTPSFESFRSHFDLSRSQPVLAFPNLGKDATLIVPSPEGSLDAYAHIGAFVRHAPEFQRDALWRLIGEEMSKQIGTHPRWLNTAGAGVPWLHVRIDSSPKYYHYAPYRNSR